MSVFITNPNHILNLPSFNFLEHFESYSNLRSKSVQENLYLSKKSNYIYENLNKSENKNEFEKYLNINLFNKINELELTKKSYNDSNLSDFNYNLSFNNWYNQSIIQKENKNELFKSHERKNQTKFLNKKRDIFEVKHRNHFSVFTPSDKNNDLRKLINVTINEPKNGKIEMYTSKNLNKSENKNEFEKYLNINLSNKINELELTKKSYNDSNLSDFNYNLSFNNWYNQSIIQKENKNELFKSHERKNQTKFLNKKRDIFEVKHRNHFSAFTPSDNNNDLRKLINVTINESKNGKIEMCISTKESEDSEDPEKQDRKKKNKRKYDVDNIRKKVKTRFLKSLKIYSNQKLKEIKSTKLFGNLPQIFVNNPNKEYNRPILYNKYEEILSKSFDDNNNEENSNLKKTEHNKSVLKYLKKKKKINNLKFLNMTYFELFNEYFKSKEFENEIAGLIKEKEKLQYIKKYIITASNFINFVLN